MKRTILLKTMLLLCALIAGSSSSWAADVSGTINFGSAAGSTKINAASVTGDDSKGNTWTITTVGTTSFTQQSGYSQVGSSSKPATSITFTTTLPASYTVKSFSAKFGGFSGTAGTVTLKVGDTTVGTGSLDATNDVVVNSTSTADGDVLTVTVTNIAKGVKCYSISYTYSTGDEPEEREVTFNYTDYQGWANSPDYGKLITMSKTDVDITNNYFYTPQGEYFHYIRFTAVNADGTITITPKNGATITQVEFYVSAEYNGYQNDQTIIPSTGTVSKNYEGTIVTWEGSASAAFTLRYNSHIHWTKIIVTYSGGTPICATPEISGTTPFTASTTVTITCATEGATISYCTSTDGVNFSSYVPYAAPFPLSQTTVVKAKATKEGMDPSEVASKTFTQQVTENIAGIVSSGASDQYVRLTDALVTYKYGTTAYLEDASGAIMLHQCAGDLEAGDKINGFMHVTNYTLYNKLPEVKAFELVDGYTKTSGNTVTPTVVTLAQLLNDPESSPYEMYLSKYVKIENATVTNAFDNKNCIIEQGGYHIVLRDQNSTATLTSNAGDFVTVTGHVAIYGTTEQIALYEQSQIVSTNASIALSSNTIEVPFAGKDGTINVTYNNITTVVAEVKFYESDGTTEATYDWLDAEINNTTNNLDYVIAANTGAARTAYMKVHAFDNELNDVYSDLITVTQAKYVPDYATLPFTFNGECPDIANTNGLTQYGLGSDYSGTTAPTTRLKFDTTGDYVILKINEIPGELSFDIKGNSFSGGTFNVQVSADGESFVNFLTYTELGDTKTESYELDSEVRYIKWIYTAKVTGNVGLGNIKVSKPVVASVDEAGFITFSCDKTVSFEGVKAYVVTAVNAGAVTLKEITEAPANTPVIIEAAQGDYKLKQIASAASVGTNLLQVSRGSTIGGSAPAYDTYVLAKKGGKVGFYKLADGVTVPAGKCYLDVKKSTSAPDFLGFEGETTGIETPKAANATGEFYNLAGQRVAQPTKGLYIVNGKKVIVK